MELQTRRRPPTHDRSKQQESLLWDIIEIVGLNGASLVSRPSAHPREIACPPSTARQAPVTKEAKSLAR